MNTLLVLLLFCHAAGTVKHSLKYFRTEQSGVPNFPQSMAAVMVNDVLVGYCDSNSKTMQPKQDWIRDFIKDDPQHLEWYTLQCLRCQQVLRDHIDDLKRRYNQTGRAHILQGMNGCEWDDETGEVIGFNQRGYDGEDFIALDLQTLTWTAPNQHAFATKLKWDSDTARLQNLKYYHIHTCPDWLKKYMHYGKRFLQRTELPSVSLLQKSPSSPVCCHATGFYPDRATLFWRKDGVEHHEDVDPGEILPNYDGSFQMSIDLNLSAVAPEDWRRYDCVFHLPGVEDDIVTRLDKALLRTNWVSPSVFLTGAVTGVGVFLVLCLALGITGFFMCRGHKNGFIRASKSSLSSDQNSDST